MGKIKIRKKNEKNGTKMSETNTTVLTRLLPPKSSVDSISAECENFCTNHNEIKMTEHIYSELEAGTCTTNVTIASKLHTECKAVIMQNTTLMNGVLVTGAKNHKWAIIVTATTLGLLLVLLLANFIRRSTFCGCRCNTKLASQK